MFTSTSHFYARDVIFKIPQHSVFTADIEHEFHFSELEVIRFNPDGSITTITDFSISDEIKDKVFSLQYSRDISLEGTPGDFWPPDFSPEYLQAKQERELKTWYPPSDLIKKAIFYIDLENLLNWKVTNKDGKLHRLEFKGNAITRFYDRKDNAEYFINGDFYIRTMCKEGTEHPEILDLKMFLRYLCRFRNVSMSNDDYLKMSVNLF